MSNSDVIIILIMSEPIVAKYGGTSMAQPDLVAGIVWERPDQRIIVVSAPGKDQFTDEKMTDTLYRYADASKHDYAAAESLRDEVIERFDGLYHNLGSTDRKEMRGEVYKHLTSPMLRSENYVVSRGEALSARYFARMIGARAVEPAIFMRGSGLTWPSRTEYAVSRQAAPGERLVVPGFYGLDSTRQVQLLNRGGSDRTGAIYAAVLGWDYENWTDVSGIFSADPRVVPGARVLREITRDEVREGAHGGSGVLQGDSILDLNGSDVVVTVKNTSQPEAKGTRVVPKLSQDRINPIVSVTGRELLQIHLHDMGMAQTKGYVAERLIKMGKLGLQFEHMPAAQDSLSLTMRVDSDREKVEEFVNYLGRKSLSRHAEVILEECGVVYVVGEDLRSMGVRSAALQRVLETAEGFGGAMPVVDNNSPSIALITKDQESVTPLIRAIHEREIER